MRLCLKEIAGCLQIENSGHDSIIVNGVAIDSRKAGPDNLFVCLPGARADGHAFAAQAASAGCAAILAARPVDVANVPVLVVPDTEKALVALASFWRDRTRAKVVCVTGTAGKTTLKEALAAIMRSKGAVSATEGNHNNQIGMPLTILNALASDDFWILEAGISHAGDMDLLGAMARPDLAVILNAGPGHTEGLGQKGVAWHKARLLNYVRDGGKALVSSDYPDLIAACGSYKVEQCFFSSREKGDCRFYLEASGPGWQRVFLDGESHSFSTPFASVFGAENVVAAVGAASLLGATPAEISAGFSGLTLPAQRFNEIVLPGNVYLFDDTYNANPLSMERALDAAARRASLTGTAFYAVLGAMGELGEEGPRCHYDLGCHLAQIGPKAIFWKGPYREDVQNGLSAGGSRAGLVSAETPEDLAAAWQELSLETSCLTALFKGSRANRLECHLAAFRQLLARGHEHVL